MRDLDKSLIAVVAAILLIVIVALVVVLRQPDQPAYRPDDTPEGVAFNYLLALQQRDYERALGYLSADLPGRPRRPEALARDLEWDLRVLERSSLAIEGMRPAGAEVVVMATRLSYSRELLGGGRDIYRFDITLRPVDDTWRIVAADDFWNWQWDREP